MSRARAASAWFLGSLGLYAISAAPGPLWGDSAKLTLYALHRYLPSANPGDHAGLTLLAQAWLPLTSWMDPSRALNLLSAFSGAVAVALLFLVISRDTDDFGRAHGAAVVLTVAHPLWWAAAVAESYAPAAALIVAVALLARREAGAVRSVAAGLVAGLAVAVHGFALLVVSPLLLVLPLRRLVNAGIGAFVGLAPIWLALIYHPADPLTGHQAGGASSWAWVTAVFIDPGRFATGLSTEVLLIVFGLGPLGLLGLAGARRAKGDRSVRPLAWLQAAAAGVLVVVLSVYSVYRLHLMILFPLLAVVLWLPPRLSFRLRVGHVVLQSAVYLVAPVVASQVGLSSLSVRRLPERENAAYFLSPVKLGERGPERYARHLLVACPPQAVVLADFNPGAVLRLVQEREHLREDVVVIPTAIDEALASSDPATAVAERLDAVLAQGRPAVLADSWEPYYRRRELEDRGYRLTPCGPGMRAWAPSDRPR